MKNSLLIFITLFSFVASAQIKIILHDDPIDPINGTTVEFSGLETDIFVVGYMEVVNQSNQPISVLIKRKHLITPTPLATEQLCNSTQCYNTGNQDIFTTPSNSIETIGVGDTVIMKPQFRPNGNAFCAYNRYYLTNQFGIALDSVDVKFNVGNQDCSGTASLNDNEQVKIGVYPNPAQNQLTANAGSSKGIVNIYDALGQSVLKAQVYGATTLDVSNLNNGVYFYSFKSDKGVSSEAKRLVIRK
ncbi:MAG: T9SS type A sorting domain-containing protein [Lishizhenia sp.]